MIEFFDFAIAVGSAGGDAAAFLARRQDTLARVGQGPTNPDFGPWIIMILMGIGFMTWYRSNRASDKAQRDHYADLRRFDRERQAAAKELDELRAASREARHVIAVMRAGGYRPEEEVPAEVPPLDDVFGAQAVPPPRPVPPARPVSAPVEEVGPGDDLQGADLLAAQDLSVQQAWEEDQK